VEARLISGSIAVVNMKIHPSKIQMKIKEIERSPFLFLKSRQIQDTFPRPIGSSVRFGGAPGIF
jgi:hypothetical protein